MPRSRRIPALAAIALLLALLAVAACDDNDSPACPAGTATPTMANLWPHADGSSWTYDLVGVSTTDSTAVLAPVGTTTLPSMDQLYAELGTPLQGAALDTVTGTYSIALAGEIVTQSGVTAQRMVETFETDGSAPVAVRGGPDALLAALARSRPDLRAVLPPRADGAAGGFAPISPPLMLGGYAFAFEDSGYFGYGDLSTAHSWIYLTDSVEVGTSFELRLAPHLVDGARLRGHVRSHRAIMVAGQRRCNAVEVQYVIDFGETTVADSNGGLLGAYRSYVAGLIVYVPEIGPVYGHERLRLHLRTAYQPDAELFVHTDQVMTLSGVVLPDG